MNTHPGFPYPLYLVISTADCLGKDPLWVAEEAILGGAGVIQLREKHLAFPGFLKLARRLKQVTDRHGVPLIINDNLAVAREINAFGIHVGNRDIPPTRIRRDWRPDCCIGYSVEYLWQLDTAEAARADYFGVSPVFNTPTKTDTVSEWGLDGIAALRKRATKPLVAIGGMNAANAQQVAEAGADSIAVVSAICGAASPREAAAGIRHAFSGDRHPPILSGKKADIK